MSKRAVKRSMGSVRGLMVAAVLACSTLLGARPAQAQGTSDLFPDPMTSAEIEASLDRIGLTGDARASALRSFEEYVTRFLDLRKSEIESYLQGRSQPGAPTGEKTREEIAARAQAREKLLKRIASIENQLFDSLASLAGDTAAQVATRERLRAERRRDWAASSPFMGRNGRVELLDILATALERANVQLGETERSAVDALLVSHEESVTGQYRKLLDAALNESVAMFDARQAANLRQPSAQGDQRPDPNAWGDYFRGLEQVRRQVREPQTEIRAAIRRSTRETADRIADALPASVSAAFRDAFYARAYPSLANPRDPVPPLVKAARELAEKGDLDAATLANVESIAAGHASRRHDLTSRIAEKLESEARGDGEFFVVFAPDEEDGQRTESESTRLLAERTKLDAATIEALGGAAPKLAEHRDAKDERRTVNINGAEIELPEGAASVTGTAIMVVAGDAGGGGMGDGEPIIFTEMSDDDGFAFAGLANIGGGPQVGVVPPMGREWLERIRKDYGLNDGDTSVLELLFDDYRQKHGEIEAGELAELKSLPSGMGGMMVVNGGPDGAVEEPPKATAESTRRRYELKRSITQRTIALDQEFFDGLGAAFGDRVPAPEIGRLKRERERSAYLAADRGGAMAFGAFGQSKASTLDLAEIVRDAKLDAAALDAIRGRLDAWDLAATDGYRQRFAERMAAQEAQEELERQLSEKSAAEGRPGEIRIETGDDFAEKMQKIQERANRADDATRSMNEGARDDMVSAIAADESKRLLRDAWNRKAWPNVFRDRRSVQPKLEEVLAYADLTDEQRARVETIGAEHRAEYRRIGDEMIEAHETSVPKPGANGEPGFDINALRKRQETMNRLTFERDELNEKTFRRLKECLNEEQSKRLGEMPERKKRGTPGIGGAGIRIGS